MTSVVARFLPPNAAERKTLTPYLRPTLHNWNGSTTVILPTGLAAITFESGL